MSGLDCCRLRRQDPETSSRLRTALSAGEALPRSHRRIDYRHDPVEAHLLMSELMRESFSLVPKFVLNALLVLFEHFLMRLRLLLSKSTRLR